MTFVAGYTNGYIYYTPTADQRNNSGYAQEDCDTLVAPEWQGAVRVVCRRSVEGDLTPSGHAVVPDRVCPFTWD